MKQETNHIEESLKQLGFKKHTSKYVRNAMISIKNIIHPLLKVIVRYSDPKEDGYVLHWSIALYSDDDLMHYLFVNSLNKKSYEYSLLEFVCIRDYRCVTWLEYQSLNNQITQRWKHSDFENFINFFKEQDEKLQNRFKGLDSVLDSVHDKNKQQIKKGIERGRTNLSLSQFENLQTVALYKLIGDIPNAIKALKEVIDSRDKEDQNEFWYKRLVAYLEYLENGTPLPNIPSPYDSASIFQLTDNDIYIAINKKTIKDIDLLEYFGGAKRFEKAQKNNYDENLFDRGLTLSKLGKWSILRLSIELLENFDKEKMDNLFTTLSLKYTQTILFINQDTTATFGFEIYKKGELVRRWMCGDGEVLENSGKPLNNEKKQFGDRLAEDFNEECIVSFLDTLLKITHGDLDNSKSVYYALKNKVL